MQKYKKYFMNDFQLLVYDKAQSIDSLVDSIDENNKNILKHVNDFDNDF
jgi:hypothetical protein